MARPLGRIPSPDDEHIQAYPLRAEFAPPKPVPMAIGVNWYEAFDRPVQDKQRHWWIGRDGNLGRIRGGHCVALKHRGASDLTPWWDFYNQGEEGACVGFGVSRMMTLINRKRYFARWLWDRSKEIDYWADTNPGDDEGTSVNAALKILLDRGHVSWRRSLEPLQTDWRGRIDLTPVSGEGIQRFRWATSADDVLKTVGYQDVGYVDILNSWGRDYPHLVRVPAEVVDRLVREDGEFGVITDR